MSKGNGNPDGKYNEITPPAQVWFSSDKTITFQDGPIQVYTERNLKSGSIKTQFFIKAMK